MEVKIFFVLIVLAVISTGTVFAQEPLITIQTDDNNYDEGDTVVISGHVKTVIGGTPVIIQIIHQSTSTIVQIEQLTVAQDGTFSKTILAEGPLWGNKGTYIAKAAYQDTIIETEFSFTPKKAAPEATSNFEVDAGSYGTFDVEYTIKGGTIKDMVVDSDIFALIVQVDATDEGTITLDLPREFIGAEKQDGKDDTFIILIDGIEVAYQESVVNSDSRVITINFEEQDSDIEIIGTYVVPEFGTMVMIVLVTGIMTTILVARNKFQFRV